MIPSDFSPSNLIRDPSLPLVSIVTPSYNQGQFIRQTIDSVLSQDYPNIEYWVIDGGSTDNTIAILQDYCDDRRLRWLSEPDRGQADAVNKGWNLCQGDILGWLNSDDLYLDQAISRQVQALLDHPQVGVVYGDAILTDERNQVIGRYHTRPFDRTRFLHVSSIPQPSAFLRRSLIEQYGGLDLQWHYALDFDLFLRLMWHTDFLYTGQEIATYRFHTSSKTVSHYDRMLAETIAVVEQICDAHPQELPNVKAKAVSDWYWMGVINSLEAGNYSQALTYAQAALRMAFFRPRMAMVGLKIIDYIFHLKLSDTLISWLDRWAKNRSNTAGTDQQR